MHQVAVVAANLASRNQARGAGARTRQTYAAAEGGAARGPASCMLRRPANRPKPQTPERRVIGIISDVKRLKR